MKYLISIPVHEEPLVIVDQINNIKKYFKDIGIILHISESFYNIYTDALIRNIDNVWINPSHLKVQWGDVLEPHLSNFEYAKNCLPTFEYFIMHASNDMYIKFGAENYIDRYQAGFMQHLCMERSLWWPSGRAIKDPYLKLMMQECGQSHVIASQIEGSFYHCVLMEKICTIINKYRHELKTDNKYPREEVYFSTIASAFIEKENIGKPITFSEIHRYDRVLWRIQNITRKIIRMGIPREPYEVFEKWYSELLFKCDFYKINKNDIKYIREGNRRFLYKYCYLNDKVIKYQLYSGQIFSVKRVERRFNNPLREYIRNLD
jgi:hypothetical protein